MPFTAPWGPTSRPLAQAVWPHAVKHVPLAASHDRSCPNPDRVDCDFRPIFPFLPAPQPANSLNPRSPVLMLETERHPAPMPLSRKPASASAPCQPGRRRRAVRQISQTNPFQALTERKHDPYPFSKRSQCVPKRHSPRSLPPAAAHGSASSPATLLSSKFMATAPIARHHHRHHASTRRDVF